MFLVGAKYLIVDRTPKIKNVIVYIVLLVLSSWVYGALVGVLYGVPNKFIFANFAGLIFYSVLIFIYMLNPKFKLLSKLFNLVGVIIVTYGAFFIFNYGIFEIISRSTALDGDSISDYRMGFSLIYLYIFPSFALLFYDNFSQMKNFRFKNLIPLLFLSFFIVFPTFSKGYILSLFLIVFFLSVTFLFHQRKTIWKTILSIFLVVVLCYLFYFNLESIENILVSFSSKEQSNAVRNEQLWYLVDEFSFFGMGLGSTLESGYIRSSLAPYGYELTIINLIVKLSWFAIPILSLYIFPTLLAIKNIITKSNPRESTFALGCFMFIIPGAANPLLLAPNIVLLHCIGLYVLFNKDVSS